MGTSNRVDLWLSVNPVWAKKILSGEKIVELRRRSPQQDVERAVIYSTSPDSSIIATARVSGIVECRVAHLWNEYGADSAVTKQQFEKYFAGCSHGTAIVLADVDEWDRPVSHRRILERSGIVAPQGWRYVSPDAIDELRT